VPPKAAAKLERLLLYLALIVVMPLAMAWLSLPAPASAQQPTAPTATLTPRPTLANPTPAPTLGKLESIRDILSVTVPRDQRPRDNDVRFDRISIDQGLSQSTVETILQDSKGFMWFGTEDGLNKYDGYSFTVFRHDPRDPNSLSNNYVRCMLEDHTGMLWIGTWGGGLDRFDPQSGQFTHYRHDPADRHSVSHDNILSIHEDGVGVLWIGTGGGGLDQFDRETERFLHYSHNPHDARSLSDNTVLAIHQDRWGELWVGTLRGGLNLFDRANQDFVRYQNNPDDPRSLSSNHVTAIQEDSTGVIWVGTAGGGLNRLDREMEQFIHYQHDADDVRSLSSNDVQAIYNDRSGVLWIGTNGGGLDRLVLSEAEGLRGVLSEAEGLDRGDDQFIHCRNDLFDPHSLSRNDVWSIYEDRGGVLWIGTFGGGLNKANRANQKFVQYRKDAKDPNSLSDNRVWAICEDQSGVLWIGTYGGGLNRFDPDSGQWTHYRHDPNDPHSLSHDVVRSIYEDRAGVLWIGTDGGLDRLDRESGRFIHYRHNPGDPHSLSHNSVGPIYEDSSGWLWIGTLGGGLNRLVLSEAEGLDREAGRFTRYQHDAGDPHSLSHNDVSAIYESDDGVLWIGTVGGGLNRLDLSEAEGFTAYRHDPDDPRSLSNDRVFCIGEDYQRRLYVGTWGGGLNRLDRRSELFSHFREKDGLPNDVIYGIVEDNATFLWLSTNRGLSRLNPASHRFRNYDVSDGLQSSEFNKGAYHKGESGVVYFGGINGFNAFYPPQVQDNPHAPPVVITAFRKLDRAVLTDISENQTIDLSYSDRFIAFEFAALDYTAPHKNQYLYRLEGFDSNWVNAGTRRYQSYSNLRGGEYVFRVKGSNNDGIWSTEGLAIHITVTPPVWETWWFRGGLALLLVGGVIAGYRLRVKNIEMRTRELKAQVDERTYEIQRRRLVAEGLREILVILNSNRSLKESLDYIASQAALLTGADKSIVFRRGESGPEPIILGSYGAQAANPLGADLPPRTLEWIVQSLLTGETLIVPGPESDGADEPEVGPPSLDEHHAILGIPLSVSGEVFGGLVLFYAQERSFAEEDLELGVTLVDQAALAIANAQLRDRIEQMAAQTERSRLARDLHDAVTQTLFSASLIAEVLPSLWEGDPDEGRQLLTELRQLSRGALAEMRALLLELRPAALVEASLDGLLRQLAEAITGRTGLPITVTVEGQCALPDDVHVALYRIAQEALNNVVKHAQASQVVIHLRCSPLPARIDGATSGAVGEEERQKAKLQVSDDGRGFDPARVSPDHLGLGLDIIHERAQAIGATIQIDSQPGQGTRVTAVWRGDE
jgi:signal transduction histidine kinase/ligand-binding sensor domain-containing protein